MTVASPRATRAPVHLRHRRSVRRLSAGQLADLRQAIVLAQGIKDDRGYQYWAGIHGLPLPVSCKHGSPFDHPAYAGSLYVFGHGSCHGDPGHCDVPEERDPFDYRLPHHLEPAPRIITVSAAIARLVEAGKSKASVDVFVHGPEGEPLKTLEFSRLRLLTYV